MNSEDIIKFRNDIVCTSDIFNSLCGNFIGEGFSRCVFDHATDINLVVKIATTSQGVRSNCSEFEIWDEVKGLKGNLLWVKDWLAPVEYISENGNVLIMHKTFQKPNKKNPTEVPKFLLDVKENNFGWIGNKYVCHDYGFIHGFIKYEKKFKKVDW